ncbi:MAG: DUF354 domain-containing protein [Candidatus Sumerlaeia bacterium]|nr:DUF354 domain-containing protein [Candidatus Sumerlaeia bacterium]
MPSTSPLPHPSFLRIWIDLANSPHVLFFAPIVADLRAAGHTVHLTARDFAQTLELARLFDLEVETVGVHGGGNPLRKILNIAGRALALRRLARARRFDLAVSHNSYAQCLAARLAGIPTVTLMDYEYQPANHLSFRLAHRVMVPETFPEQALRHYGASLRRVFRYPGLKEEVYLQDYRPDPNFPTHVRECAARQGLAISPEHVLVTVRPPATMAAYHQFENPLFYDLLRHLGGRPEARLLVFPRTPAQKAQLQPRLPANAVIPDAAFDGRHLIYFSDLMISAGGTMNREAAVLGTPVYSIFAGRLGAVDRHLIETGRMRMIRHHEDIAAIRVEKKTAQPQRFDFRLRALLIEKCLETAYAYWKK